MDKEAEEVNPSRKGEELASSHGKAIIEASSSGSKSWIRSQDPRIVRVSRAFGGKDRHSKVCTIKGLRDRRVRLSVPTAIQLYDLQDRLGLSQPSKVVDWLLDAAKHEIDELPPLPIVPGTNFVHSIYHPRLSTTSPNLVSNLDGLVCASSSLDHPNAWTTSGHASKRNLRAVIMPEHDDECRLHDSGKGSQGQRQERNGRESGSHIGPSIDTTKWSPSEARGQQYSYNSISQVVFRSPVTVATQRFFPNSITTIPKEDNGVRQSTSGDFANEIGKFPFRR